MYECQDCGSTDTAKLSVVYGSQTSTVGTQIAGVGVGIGGGGPGVGVGAATTTGTVQSLQAQSIAPPKKPDNSLGSAVPLVISRRAELLDHPRLIAQLCALERRTARSGRDSIDHAPGAHDDVANAVAGALDMDVRAPGDLGITL